MRIHNLALIVFFDNKERAVPRIDHGWFTERERDIIAFYEKPPQCFYFVRPLNTVFSGSVCVLVCMTLFRWKCSRSMYSLHYNQLLGPTGTEIVQLL